jgi:hypothetical protein
LGSYSRGGSDDQRNRKRHDYTQISAKGYVPALQQDSGENYRSLCNPATAVLVREERLAELNKRHALIEGTLRATRTWSAKAAR